MYRLARNCIEATIIAGDRSLNAFVTEAIQEKIFREKPSLK